MATRPSHIYASTLSRRERAWGRHRRRRMNMLMTPLAMLLSAMLGVVIQHVA